MRVLPLAANAAGILAGLALGTALRGAPPAANAHGAAAVPLPAASAPAAPVRFAFRRPFVVPVADGWRAQALVVLNVELALTPEDGEVMGRVLEARLRDRVTPVLLDLGRAGAFEAMPPASGAIEAAIAAAISPLLRGAPAVTVTAAEKRRL